MTFFDEISGKLKLIQSHENTQLVRDLTEHITAKLKQSREHGNFGPGFMKYLTFDLSYILFRHQAWHHAPLFLELTIDYLNSEFRLARPLSTELVETCLDIFAPYLSSEDHWQPDTYDREFLFDLFVASATAKNEAQLRTDLGFGRNVIRLFHSAAQLVNDCSSSVFSFAPEITQTILDIMHDIAREAESVPWIMDLYRLRLITSQQRLGHQKRISRSQLRQLFQVLFLIGWQGARHSQLAKNYEDWLKEAGVHEIANHSEQTVLTCEQALYLLNQFQLIYRHQIRGENYFHLSATGLDLTAERLAHEYMKQQSLELASLVSLPAAIQAKVLAYSYQPDEAAIKQFFQMAHRLAPEAIEVIVTKLAGSPYNQQVLELLQKLLHNNQNAWARVKLMKALTESEGFTKSQVLPILHQMTTADPSPMVRKAARAMQVQVTNDTGYCETS